MASIHTWLNTQIAIHNIRVSPRLPIDERIKRFYTSYAAQQGITLDDEDADLCAMLVLMRHGEGVEAEDALTSLYQMETNEPVQPTIQPTIQIRQTRQMAIQKCRRSPRFQK